MHATATRSKWQRTGALVTATVQLQRTATGPHLINTAVENARLAEKQIRRARGAYAGLFLLMVIVWSTILISAVFSLRINREACEQCPLHCQCREAPPAWG